MISFFAAWKLMLCHQMSGRIRMQTALALTNTTPLWRRVKNQPRAATVKAGSLGTRALRLDRASFDTVVRLGDREQSVRRV